VSPDTPGLSQLLASSETGQQRLQMISNSVPLGRLGTHDEIAKAVVFLAPYDSSYNTGTELFLDGGFAQVWAAIREPAVGGELNQCDSVSISISVSVSIVPSDRLYLKI